MNSKTIQTASASAAVEDRVAVGVVVAEEGPGPGVSWTGEVLVRRGAVGTTYAAGP